MYLEAGFLLDCSRKWLEKVWIIVFLQLFDTLPILPFKVEKMKLKTAVMSHSLEIFMPHLSVREMKTAASWEKNDPILETREIAL